MKGGGLTWAGWLGIGVGAMLIYAGMTGQSLIAELSGVLTGKGLVKGVAPATAGGDGLSGFGGAGTAGGGAGGGGVSSWNPAGAAPSSAPFGGPGDAEKSQLTGRPRATLPAVSPRVPAVSSW